MPRYVDGFVIPVPKKNLAAYTKMARAASKVWKEYGALAYRECVGDDMKIKGMPPFASLFKVKTGEAIVFSYIVYKSKAHRDEVNKLVMKDPRILKMMKIPPPFDCKRMAYAGFKTIIEA